MNIKSMIPQPAKKAIREALDRLRGVQEICREEYQKQKFDKHNERSKELEFIFRQMGRFYPRTILDVGTGKSALPAMMRNAGPEVTAIDNITDYWSDGMVNRHYHVIDDDIRATKLTGQYDLVTCVSVLEHIDRHDDAVRNMLRLTKPGGHLIITCPYNERTYCEDCYELPDSAYGKDEPYGAKSFSRKQLDQWCQDNPVEIIEQEYWQFWTGELWTQGEQIIPPNRAKAGDPHQHTCLLLRKLA